MPEQVRLKMGAASNTQFAVYTEFARTIPGFITMNDRDINMLMPKNTIQVIISTNFFKLFFFFIINFLGAILKCYCFLNKFKFIII